MNLSIDAKYVQLYVQPGQTALAENPVRELRVQTFLSSAASPAGGLGHPNICRYIEHVVRGSVPVQAVLFFGQFQHSTCISPPISSPNPLVIRLILIARDTVWVYAVMEYLPGPEPGHCPWLSKKLPSKVGGELFRVVCEWVGAWSEG